MIRVHFHLTKRIFVIGQKVPGKGWRKVAETPAVCLDGVRFVVSVKGRDYCRTHGMRWVHAWAEGELCDCLSGAGEPVLYNPFRDEGFRLSSGRLVTRAAHATFTVDAQRRALTHATDPG